MKKFFTLFVVFFTVSVSSAAMMQWTIDGIDNNGNAFGDGQGSLFFYYQTGTDPIEFSLENGTLTVKNGTFAGVSHAFDNPTYFYGEKNVELESGQHNILAILTSEVGSTLDSIKTGFYNYLQGKLTWNSATGGSFDLPEDAPGGINNPLKTSLEVVPEPTTLALLALGIAAFGLKRKVS